MSDKNKLDKEFEEVVAVQINEKIRAAATAIAEANTLFKEHGLERIVPIHYGEDYFDTKEEFDAHEAKLSLFSDAIELLEKEMNKSGWQTSSSHC